MDFMRSQKKMILIVDDEEDITWSISKGMSKDNPGLEVVCANDGDTALDILSSKKIDLLVTDIRMPGVDGRQLFEQVRQLNPSMHILVMTAYGSRDVNEWLKAFGTVECIEKPFEIAEIRKRILNVIGNNGTPKHS
jgi:two-component system, response regulator, stage 0 sporulation protein F